MVSLDRANHRPGQSSDCKTLNGHGPVALWCLGHSLFQCPIGHVYCHPPSGAPSVHTGYTGPIQVPMGLMVCKDQIGPEKPVSPLLAFEWSKPLPSSGPFAYFSGCVQSFQPYPYYWKPKSLLKQIVHWNLRTSSCFLNFASDVWDTLGYEMHSQNGLSLEGGGIQVYILLKSFY